MKRKFRLTNSTDFMRVRRSGKSYAHPLVVLIAAPNELEQSRVGVAAGRNLGKAVQRNRAKRRLRSAIQPWLSIIQPGWDVILIARQPLNQARFMEIQVALRILLMRAAIVVDRKCDGAAE